MSTETAPESCPFCHSARDPVLKSTTWACGVRLKDPTWRTKECYKRNLASATRERDDWKRVAEELNAFMERARSKTENTREGLGCLRQFDALKAKEAQP